MSRYLLKTCSIVLMVAAVATTVAAQPGPRFERPFTPFGRPTAQEGLLIAAVVPDSPADKAGLIRGDVLLSIEGRKVNTIAEVREVLYDHKAGESIRLEIVRGGEPQTVNLTTEDRLYRPALGVQFAAPPAAGEFMPLSAPGVRIVEVTESSPAADAGLQPGDIITAVNGKAVRPQELPGLVRDQKPGDTMTLSVVRKGERPGDTETIEVNLGKNDDGEAYLGIQFTGRMRIPSFEEMRERMKRRGPELRQQWERRAPGGGLET